MEDVFDKCSNCDGILCCSNKFTPGIKVTEEEKEFLNSLKPGCVEKYKLYFEPYCPFLEDGK